MGRVHNPILWDGTIGGRHTSQHYQNGPKLLERFFSCNHRPAAAFSLLSNLFSSCQGTSLEDYVELSVMIQYNNR